MPRPSALINVTNVVPEAFHELTGKNCAVYQVAKHLDLEYDTLAREMVDLYVECYGEPSDCVTPRTLLLWCERNQISA